MRLKLASPLFHSSVRRRKGAKHFRLVQQLQNFANVWLCTEEAGLDVRLSLRGARPRSEEAIPSSFCRGAICCALSVSVSWTTAFPDLAPIVIARSESSKRRSNPLFNSSSNMRKSAKRTGLVHLLDSSARVVLNNSFGFPVEVDYACPVV